MTKILKCKIIFRFYVKYIEKAIGCPITYISVGPERDSIIYRKGAVEND